MRLNNTQPPIPPKCQCAKCSQGFCHFCEPNKNVVMPRTDYQGYCYLPGASLMQIPLGNGKAKLVSSCNGVHK